ncbi:M6 family metalloprotease domain-containing protein [Streptomyces sp. CRN 30]|uniref:M6 family metalloprotease domain-containing protein n=1 Tax=Streptomyces sp. CRN 30 TaxID=3075613 RepID=UPI002A830743|nr:M6 family metalloprotease domain-containing protein [Streptomyces sp. CRN 30]
MQPASRIPPAGQGPGPDLDSGPDPVAASGSGSDPVAASGSGPDPVAASGSGSGSGSERNLRRRIRPRRVAALASVTALTLAVSTSAGTVHLRGHPTEAAGATPLGHGTPLAPCMISGPLDVQMTEGIPTPPGYARSTGTVRALNLMIDFADAPGEGTALERLAEFAPQTRAWFATSSYGRLDYRAEAPIGHWLRMPKPFSAYGLERGAPFEPGYRKLVEDLVAVADPAVDFPAYDLLNVLVTPNAGPSALDTVLSVTFAGNRDAPDADGTPLSNASFVYSRQDDGSGAYEETGYRVLPHENGHVFGLPDLYTHEGGGAAGHWDIMSEDWGADNDLLGWHKWKLGWLDETQVSCAASSGTAEYTLTPLPEPGGAKLVVVPLDSRTAYAVELRTRGGNDVAVCRPGILVYKVDATVDTGDGPVRVFDSRRDSGGCTRSPNVHAELSDATFVPGETFEDRRAGIAIAVAATDAAGDHRVRVTRR